MRWERLFEDLEGQLEAASVAELAGEVAERTRIELGRLSFADRLMAAVGELVALDLLGGASVEGRLERAAEEWLVLRQGVLPALIPLRAVITVSGLGIAAAEQRSVVLRRLSFASVLRAVARDRSPVRIESVSGRSLSGTVDAVGADHLDLAEHPADEPRRPAAVRRVLTVPFPAVAVVRPVAGSSSLLD